MAEVRSSNLLEPIFRFPFNSDPWIGLCFTDCGGWAVNDRLFPFTGALPPDFCQEDRYERISSTTIAEGTNSEFWLDYPINLENNAIFSLYPFPIFVGIIFENRGKTLYEIGNAD